MRLTKSDNAPESNGELCDAAAAAKIEIATQFRHWRFRQLPAATTPKAACASFPARWECFRPICRGREYRPAFPRSGRFRSKEGRRLVLHPTDTPFSRIHIREYAAGAAGWSRDHACNSLVFIITRKPLIDLVTQCVCRVLAQLGLPQNRQFVARPVQPRNRRAPIAIRDRERANQ